MMTVSAPVIHFFRNHVVIQTPPNLVQSMIQIYSTIKDDKELAPCYSIMHLAISDELISLVLASDKPMQIVNGLPGIVGVKTLLGKDLLSTAIADYKTETKRKGSGTKRIEEIEPENDPLETFLGLLSQASESKLEEQFARWSLMLVSVEAISRRRSYSEKIKKEMHDPLLSTATELCQLHHYHVNPAVLEYQVDKIVFSVADTIIYDSNDQRGQIIDTAIRWHELFGSQLHSQILIPFVRKLRDLSSELDVVDSRYVDKFWKERAQINLTRLPSKKSEWVQRILCIVYPLCLSIDIIRRPNVYKSQVEHFIYDEFNANKLIFAIVVLLGVTLTLSLIVEIERVCSAKKVPLTFRNRLATTARSQRSMKVKRDAEKKSTKDEKGSKVEKETKEENETKEEKEKSSLSVSESSIPSLSSSSSSFSSSSSSSSLSADQVAHVKVKTKTRKPLLSSDAKGMKEEEKSEANGGEWMQIFFGKEKKKRYLYFDKTMVMTMFQTRIDQEDKERMTDKFYEAVNTGRLLPNFDLGHPGIKSVTPGPRSGNEAKGILKIKITDPLGLNPEDRDFRLYIRPRQTQETESQVLYEIVGLDSHGHASQDEPDFLSNAFFQRLRLGS